MSLRAGRSWPWARATTHLADDWLAFHDLLDVTTDFRSVYATAFANFLGADPVPILGGSFPTLGYL